MKVRLEVSDQEILYHIADVVKNKQRKLSTAECVILDLANKLPSHATSQKGGWAVTDTWHALVREQYARSGNSARCPLRVRPKQKPPPFANFETEERRTDEQGDSVDRNELARLRYMQSLKRKETQ